jgi:hypothetical protein
MIKTYFLVGMLAPIIGVYWLSTEIFADLGIALNRFQTSGWGNTEWLGDYKEFVNIGRYF